MARDGQLLGRSPSEMPAVPMDWSRVEEVVVKINPLGRLLSSTPRPVRLRGVPSREERGTWG